MVRVSMRGALLVLAVSSLALACGGRAREDGVAAAAGGASGDGAQSIGGERSGGSGQSPDAGVSTSGAAALIALGCPDPTTNVACPAVSIDLAFDHSLAGSSNVEALQIPSYGTRPPGFEPYDLPDPSLWDRAPLPAGACVFRLHGVSGSCVRPGHLFLGSCSADTHVAPLGFYETAYCGQGVPPGCPTSDPWGAGGDWWYLVPRGSDTDVVICAPLCAQSVLPSGIDCLGLQ